MGISMWQLLIVLAIIVLLFGTKKLKNLGGDLGSAVKGFKKAMSDGDSEDSKQIEQKENQVIDAKVERADEKAENNTKA